MKFLFSLFASFLFAELVGYVVHKLLHSEKIEWLSRSHMIHHLKIYSPKAPQRPSEEYHKSIANRSAFLGLGLEWVVPLGIAMSLVFAAGYLISVPWTLTLIFSGGAISWGYFLFGYMHDNMHRKNFWMERNSITQSWFLRIRRLHDIHHLHFDDEGLNNVNYGICFYFFDRLFSSYKKDFSKFNNEGYKAALGKYHYLD